MRGWRSSNRVGALVLVLAVVLVFGVVACGSDDDGGGGGGAGGAVSAGGDERQIADLVREMQEQMVAGDGERLCPTLTAAGREEVVAYGRQVGRAGSCEAVIARIARATAQSGVKQKPSRVLSVRVSGAKATAMVTNAGRPPEALEVVKEDGRWKLPTVGLSDPLAAPGGGASRAAS